MYVWHRASGTHISNCELNWFGVSRYTTPKSDIKHLHLRDCVAGSDEKQNSLNFPSPIQVDGCHFELVLVETHIPFTRTARISCYNTFYCEEYYAIIPKIICDLYTKL